MKDLDDTLREEPQSTEQQHSLMCTKMVHRPPYMYLFGRSAKLQPAVGAHRRNELFLTPNNIWCYQHSLHGPRRYFEFRVMMCLVSTTLLQYAAGSANMTTLLQCLLPPVFPCNALVCIRLFMFGSQHLSYEVLSMLL